MKKIPFIFAALFLAFLISCAPEANDVNPYTYYNGPSGGGNSSPSGGNPSSSSRAAVVTGSFTDSRDGQSYGTVAIGSQTWMAKNLNYDASGSVCYDNQNSYCDTYGRLYDWATAKTACPNGWHLPSDAEWSTLENSVGGSSTAGRHLKATSGWYSNGNGLDTYGFSALPGGNGYSGGYFDDVGNLGGWWSSTEYDGDIAYLRYMYYHDEDVYRLNIDKVYLFSVRCLQD